MIHAIWGGGLGLFFFLLKSHNLKKIQVSVPNKQALCLFKDVNVHIKMDQEKRNAGTMPYTEP